MVVLAERLAGVGRQRVVAAVAGLLVAGAFAGWLTSRPSEAAPAPVPASVDVQPPADALVFVSGAVQHPGLYRLSPDARVADAIAAAGGITPLADPGHMPDLAGRVHDGRQVNVPFTRSGGATTARLDINAAAADEIDSVPGAPPGLGEAIVEYREEWGPLTSIAELRSALGLDAATVSALGHYLRVVVPAS